jgi:hypothetical protein
MLFFNDVQNTTGSNGSSHIEFQTTTGGSRTTKMQLSALGNLSITGTTLTAANIGSVTPGTNGAACFSSAGVLGTDSANCIASLREYKQDFQPILGPEAVDIVSRLGATAVHYRLTDKFLGKGKNKPHARDMQPGFIAEEVEKIDPRYAAYNGSKLHGVKYEQLSATEAAAIRELKIENDAQAARLKVLEDAHWYDWFVKKWHWLRSKVK